MCLFYPKFNRVIVEPAHGGSGSRDHDGGGRGGGGYRYNDRPRRDYYRSGDRGGGRGHQNNR